MTFLLVPSTIFTLQLVVAILLLTRGLPQKKPSTKGVFGLACMFLVAFALPWVNQPALSLNPIRELLVFIAVLAAMVVGTCCLWDIELWPALFCATAGYTMQNLASSVSWLVHQPKPGADILPAVVDVLITVIVYTIIYLVFIRRLDGEAILAIHDKPMLAMFAVVSLAVIGLDVLLKNVAATTADISQLNLTLLRLAHILSCVFVLFSEYQILYVRSLRADQVEMEHMLAERAHQYETARDNIESINVRLHDIQHWIRHYEGSGGAVGADALDDIAREVSVYDTAVKTGNEALDTVLTEKSLACERRGLQLLCMADGAALDFMRPTDLYALFGNALDNAIEAAVSEMEPDRQVISLSVRRIGQMAAVNVENYCTHELVFRDGLPVTTKDDLTRHGYGMRSMRLIAEKYDGSLEAYQHGDVFSLNILLTVPET